MKSAFWIPVLMMLFLLPARAGAITASPLGGIHLPPDAVPILPLPQHVEQFGNQPGSPITAGPLAGKGLTPAAEENLHWHWARFLKEYAAADPRPQDAIEIGILGKDRSFDKAVAGWVSPWAGRIGKEGYVLILRNKKRFLAARTETGLFYGLQSLEQLIRAGWKKDVLIADWPCFDYRVIYDDISRGPISTVDYIKKQIRRMAGIKINYLSFYIENVVQPSSHPDFAPADGKLTITQIKELSAYAARFHMQLIGSFQSFGHFEKILSLPRYASLGATSTLISPTDPQAKQFLKDVIGELCDAFNAPWFNVNCDETFDLGQGSTKPAVDSLGAAAVYAAHLRFLYDIVKQHGKKMMMWGDFAVAHPDVLEKLPRDIVYLTWEYGDQPDFSHWIKPFSDRHLAYMVCPGILNSYRMFPDMAMARANISGFTRAGYGQGAQGVITTVWDDGGTYLFSGDWYGVYVAAEKSWTQDSTADRSFNDRYEQTAYGTHNGNYVKALFTLMKLRTLPLTYDLSDRLWQQQILPDSGKKMILNNTGGEEAARIIEEAGHYIRSAHPRRNQADIHTLAFSIDQYRLIIETRLGMAAMAGDYVRAVSATPQRAASILGKELQTTEDLIKAYGISKHIFKQAWLRENQPYWLSRALAPYDKKINDLEGLSMALKENRKFALQRHALSSPSAVRLQIRESTNYYFQNWMLAGPFPLSADKPFPHFLYSDNPEYDKPPSPGDFTQYRGKLYRWKKFASAAGGIIDAGEKYEQAGPALIYAYCSITSDSAETVPAFVQTDIPLEIYCNGKKLSGGNQTQKETKEIREYLPLKAGTNQILLKFRKGDEQEWTFTFRLGNQLAVTSHKHKYRLNVKTAAYDEE